MSTDNAGVRFRAACLLLTAAAVAAAPWSGLPATSVSTPEAQHQAPSYRSGTVPGTDCPLFPANNYWRTRVDRLPVAKRSQDWVASIGRSEDLHPDFRPSFGEQPVPYGIGVTIVGNGHATQRVKFYYPDESDHVRYPLGSDTFIEGGWGADGDRHTILVNKDTCRLYETYDTHRTRTGWTAGSGATWSLRSNRLRPATWTSADAAGLPILPGLLTYDEVKAGRVAHAIRFTAPVTQDRFIWPARHRAGASTSPTDPPMGARFRLRRSFDVSGYSRSARVVLLGMKRYGLVLADNGAPWYFQGTADRRWPIALVDQLKRIPARAFEAVDTSGVKVRANSGRARH